MGKASSRRRKRRQQRLGDLAGQNPRQFQIVWHRMVTSWMREISRQATVGNLEPASKVVSYALEELRKCGSEAWNLEAEPTRQQLEAVRTAAFEKLALQYPDKFKTSWNKRIGRLRRKIRGYARNIEMPQSSTVVFDTIEELDSYGPVASRQVELEETKDALRAECAAAIALAIDPRMFRLSNNRSNHEQWKTGRHSLPPW